MLIRCPTCRIGYDLATDLLTEGRILRCAHCRDAWAHSSGGVAAPLRREAAEPREIVAEARSGRPPALVAGRGRGALPAVRSGHWSVPGRRLPPASRTFGAAAAGALIMALSGGGMAAVAGKERVVAAFPASAAIFSTLGLPVNLRGLAIADVHATVRTGDGPPTLLLEGRITNRRQAATAVPSLRIAVRDSSQRELYFWTAPAPKAELAIGETVSFQSRLSSPPRDGQDLAVSFVDGPAVPRRMAEAAPARP